MKRTSRWTLPVVVLLGLPMVGSTGSQTDKAATGQQALPEGVTAALIEEGKTLFHGDALCASCHGQEGIGTPIGPTFADTTWLHIDGSYPAIVQVIKDGVPTPKESMVPMLAKGGSAITDAQVSAVAAYVWRLSHGS